MVGGIDAPSVHGCEQARNQQQMYTHWSTAAQINP